MDSYRWGLLQRKNAAYKHQCALAPHLRFAFISPYHLFKSSRIGDLHSLFINGSRLFLNKSNNILNLINWTQN